MTSQAERMASLQMELDETRGQLTASRARLDRLNSDNSTLQTALDKLTRDHESAIKELTAKIAQVESELTEAYETRLSELRSQHQRVSHEVRKDHEAQLRRLEIALSETSQVHAQKEAELRKELEQIRVQRDHIKVSLEAQLYVVEIDRLTRALEAAEVKYMHRESRPEDVEKMQRSEMEIERRDRAIMAMTDEINRLRLEVQSREDSLHRLFGNRPVVGVLNPNPKKTTPLGSRNALDSGFARAGALPPLSKTASVESVGSIRSVDAANKNQRRASSARPLTARNPS
ncbi:hypothetical protein BCR44DRAFT_1436813 [Catenaria anguillulae PL171]|uniref:Uncharacterized protein n=1 Tax=Catenaria anguillulae PL171 TaxID=765915 RepID=A0A1Y2HI03_9FUNG|nr:hypothetical protein BCR44DRAFT_1436813 [Catenaria anguillulae PL171]